LTQTDFPHAFQNIIIYHNIKKYSHNTFHQDIWMNAMEPFINNEREVYFKLEIDEEAVAKVKQDMADNKNIGIQNKQDEPVEGEEPPAEGEGAGEAEVQDRPPLPGERELLDAELDDIILACAPYPTNKTHDVLPRYLTRIHQVDC
jgi:hypothetical protein